jgi:hypothetical protein
MARKAARLERVGALTPRDRMWSAIRALGVSADPSPQLTPFSSADVTFLANHRLPAENHVHIDSVITYLLGLSRAAPPYVKLIEGERPAGRRREALALYHLVRDVGVDAPRVTDEGRPVNDGACRDQLWGAIKALREFDRVELLAAASTPESAIRPDTARRYLYHLELAGYLRVAKDCVRGKGGVRSAIRYRFNRSMNSGPRAPIVCQDKSVMDANTGKIVFTPSKGGKECRDPT